MGNVWICKTWFYYLRESRYGNLQRPASCHEASRTGGSMPTVFNAANEKAVALFLQKKIAFLDIYRIIEDAMESHKVIPAPTVEEILNIEQEIYNRIESRCRLKILIALLVFSVIVLFHELGHFLLAKRNGIAVTEFSLGMGRGFFLQKKEEPDTL